MTVLIAYDGSGNADAAITAAAELVPEGTSAIVLAVWEPLVVQALRDTKLGSLSVPIRSDVEDGDERSAHHARKLAEHGARVAGEAGFAARALWVADDRTIADTIIEAADELDVDLIVMGSRGLNGIRALMGSVSTHVLQHSQRPVLVVPAGAKPRATDELPAGAGTSV